MLLNISFRVKHKITPAIIDEIIKILKNFSDANLQSEAAREIIALKIYNELIDEVEKKDERGL